MNILRSLPLSRLLLLCAVAVAVAVGATALALAVSAGSVPAPKPLDEAVHDALAAPQVQGVSARIQFTNHLLEGASLAGNSGGEASRLASSPLISGASGRLWASADGRERLELQSEKGDTQIIYDGHAVSVYDASTNTLYRYSPPQSSATTSGASSSGGSSGGSTGGAEAAHSIPSSAKIHEGIEHLEKHAHMSGAMPTDVGGQPAYTVRISPREDGSLIGGAELSFDAVRGVPLRMAVYSTQSSSPVLELAATEVSYGPVAEGTLDFSVPADANVKNVTPSRPAGSSSAGSSSAGSSSAGSSSAGGSSTGGSSAGSSSAGGSSTGGEDHPHVTLHGKGLAAIALVQSHVKQGEAKPGSQLEGLRKVDINGTSASELPTALGTLLSFERAGVRYLLAGSVTPEAIEAFARGL